MLYFTPNWTGSLPENIGVVANLYRASGGNWVRYAQAGAPWMADNGVFVGRFSESKFYGALGTHKHMQTSCKFVICPDVLRDVHGTLARYAEHAPRIRALGYPVAYAGQDGAEYVPFPDEYDVLFLGGSTEWKMGRGTRECIRLAQAHGKPVHVGRVNSFKRLKYFADLGVDSCDGTTYTFGPSNALRNIPQWVQYQSIFTETQ